MSERASAVPPRLGWAVAILLGLQLGCSASRPASVPDDEDGGVAPGDGGSSVDAGSVVDAGPRITPAGPSFDARFTLTYTDVMPPVGPGGLPDELPVTLALLTGMGERDARLVLSGFGQVYGADLDPDPEGDGFVLRTGPAATVPVPRTGPGADCTALLPARVDTLWLALRDDDGDGAADRVVGTGEGALPVLFGDVIGEVRFDLAVDGGIDRTQPVVSLAPDTDAADRHPLDPVSFWTSEALPKGVTLVLEARDGSAPTIALEARQGSGILEPIDGIGRFEIPVGRPLAFGTVYDVVARSELVDLGGLRGAITPNRLATVADPGRVGRVDFESDVALPHPGLLTFGETTEIVHRGGPFTPPSGGSALFVGPGGRATAALFSGEPAEGVRFSYRVLSRGRGGFLNAALAAVVLDRDEPFDVTVDRGSPTGFMETGDDEWRFESEVVTGRLVIEGGLRAGETVLFDIQPFGPVRCGLAPEPAPVVIDDLRLE